MNYPEFLFSQLLSVYDDEFKNSPHDEQYCNAMRLYQDFTNSTYSLAYKSEYDCMCDYLSANAHKDAQLVDEIVESLKQFDGINAEVWKYVSEKLGYAIKEKAETPLSDAKDFNYTRELEHRLDMVQDDAVELRKFIYEKGLGKYFQDFNDAQEGYVFLNNIDIACDLSDRESLGWKRYKQIID